MFKGNEFENASIRILWVFAFQPYNNLSTNVYLIFRQLLILALQLLLDAQYTHIYQRQDYEEKLSPQPLASSRKFHRQELLKAVDPYSCSQDQLYCQLSED